MNEKKVEPTEVSYRYLIEGCCRTGNVDKAKFMLEAMRTLNLRVSLQHLNPIVLLLIRMKQFEEAEKILQDMKPLMIESENPLRLEATLYFKRQEYQHEQKMKH